MSTILEIVLSAPKGVQKVGKPVEVSIAVCNVSESDVRIVGVLDGFRKRLDVHLGLAAIFLGHLAFVLTYDVADKELMAPGGRPIEIVNGGQVIKGLLA